MIPLSKLDFELGAFTSIAKYLQRHWPQQGGPDTLSAAQQCLARILGYKDLHDAQKRAGTAQAIDYPPTKFELYSALTWGLFKACNEDISIGQARSTAHRLPLSKLKVWQCYGQGSGIIARMDWERCEAKSPSDEDDLIKHVEWENEWHEKHRFENQALWYEMTWLPRRLVSAGLSRGVVALEDGKVVVGDAVGEALDIVSSQFEHHRSESEEAAWERRRLMVEKIIPQATMELETALRRYGDLAMPSWLKVFKVIDADGKCLGLALNNRGVHGFYACLLEPSLQALATAVNQVMHRADRELGPEIEETALAGMTWRKVRMVFLNMETVGLEDETRVLEDFEPFDTEPLGADEVDSMRDEDLWAEVCDKRVIRIGEFFDLSGAIMTRDRGLMAQQDLLFGEPFQLDPRLSKRAISSPDWLAIRKLLPVLPAEHVNAFISLQENRFAWDDETVTSQDLEDLALKLAHTLAANGGAAAVQANAVFSEARHEQWEKEFEERRAKDRNPPGAIDAAPNVEGINRAKESEARRNWAHRLLRLVLGREPDALGHFDSCGPACRIYRWLMFQGVDMVQATDLQRLRTALSALDKASSKASDMFEVIEPMATKYMEEVEDRPFGMLDSDPRVVMACGW
jgi:hypothetical protein